MRDRALVDAAAKAGVILLLFAIGIEFSLEKLARLQRLIFAGGGLQVVLASAATVGPEMLASVVATSPAGPAGGAGTAEADALAAE